MAHFAELDDNNLVVRVLVIGDEHEANGEQWCSETFGGRWKQTSYTGKIRKNFASVGYTYDHERDAFIPPKHFASWVLNEETCLWEPPVPMPTDGQRYVWDENTNGWVASQGA